MLQLTRRLPKLGIVFFITACLSISMLPSQPASALSSSDFNAGHIIDDSIFTNANSMPAQSIQNFLNSKVLTCSTNHSGFTGGTGTAYNPPFVCLKDFYENPNSSYAVGFSYTDTNGNTQTGSRTYYYNNAYRVTALCPVYGGYSGTPSCGSGDYHNGLDHLIPTLQTSGLGTPSGAQSAAQIIYNAAQQYNINPQVLIVLLQKEQGLVTDDWPASYEYQSATGYGCPDTAPCSSTYAGFSNQIISAAWQFRHYLDYPNDYNYVVGNNYIQYNPSSSCGGTTVNIQNQATAALYDYTPYQPNPGALSSVSDSSPGGTATCGAYGNRNFWWYFNTWFGSTYGPTYSWDLQSVSYSTGTNIFAAGEAGTVTLKVTNTGTVPWYNYGNNPVHLGTWLPDRVSSLASSGWLSPTRPANMSEGQVQPGGTATFVFPVDVGSDKIGTYVEHLNLVVENSQWMPARGLSPTIVIKPAYQWQINNVTYGNGTGITTPGTGQLVTVSALNTGADTWSKSSGPPIRLGTWQPGQASKLTPPAGVAPKDWLSSIRTTDMNEPSVAPGQIGNFQFYVFPRSPGTFYEHFNLVAEGQAWFNDPGLTLYVAGGDYTWKPLWSSYSTGGDANMTPGTTFTVTVKAQNTGDVTWTNTSTTNNPWPVRLATTSPMDRGTLFYDSSWIRDTRPATLQETTVQPGQQGTFVFTAHIPTNTPPGPRYEHFSLVAEGMTWFNDPGFYLYINVK